MKVFEKSMYCVTCGDAAILDVSVFEKDPVVWKEMVAATTELTTRKRGFENFLGVNLGSGQKMELTIYDVVYGKKQIMSPKLLQEADLENPTKTLIFPTGYIVMFDLRSFRSMYPNIEIPQENIIEQVSGYTNLGIGEGIGPYIHISMFNSRSVPAKMIVTKKFFNRVF